MIFYQRERHLPGRPERRPAATLVLSMVRDDSASREVWTNPDHGAFGGMSSSTIAIECSTVSHAWILKLGALAEACGISLIDAPVSGSRPQADSGELVFLVGGATKDVDACRNLLMVMGAAVHHLGPLGAGTMVKLATNALMGVQVAATAELFGILSSGGVDVAKAFEAIGSTAASSLVSQRSVVSMASRNFAPQFPVSLIEKDFGYVMGLLTALAALPRSRPPIVYLLQPSSKD